MRDVSVLNARKGEECRLERMHRYTSRLYYEP